jgi:hypothetical protein
VSPPIAALPSRGRRTTRSQRSPRATARDGGSPGYNDPQAQYRAGYATGYGKAVDDGTRRVLDDLAEKSREVQTELSSVALWPSILFVTMVLIGRTLPERFRLQAQNQLHITP